jgi:hypothetical protein
MTIKYFLKESHKFEIENIANHIFKTPFYRKKLKEVISDN